MRGGFSFKSWGTLRFDDHCGIRPTDVSINGGSMSARLTRSKTPGSDRAVSSRKVFINAFKEGNGWKKVGGFWARLQILIETASSQIRPPIATVVCARNYGVIRLTRCETGCCILHGWEKMPCSRGFLRHSGLRTRLVHLCQAARRLLECPRKNEIFFWRLERARQRHVLTGRGPRHLESSTTRHLGLD